MDNNKTLHVSEGESNFMDEKDQAIQHILTSFNNCWFDLLEDFNGNGTWKWLVQQVEMLRYSLNIGQDICICAYDKYIVKKYEDANYSSMIYVLGMPSVTYDDLVELRFIKNNKELEKFIDLYKDWIIEQIKEDDDVLKEVYEGYKKFLNKGKIVLAFDPDYYQYVCGHVLKTMFLKFKELDIKGVTEIRELISKKS